MRSTFGLILVSLLLAFYAILGLTFFFFPPKDMNTPENSGEALKTALLDEAFLEHNYFSHEGCKSHEEMGRVGAIIKLAKPIGDHFAILCGGTMSPAFEAVLHRALDTQSLATGPDGSSWVIAYPFRIPGGDQLVIAQYSPLAYRRHQPWAKVLIPLAVCVLVALLLAYSYSRPVRELRSVVRSFASGQMDARVPESGLMWAAASSKEIHSLIVDFNQMADRIAGLMEAQRLLLRDVSHELRSPLARLSVALELTRDEAPASAEIHLQRIEDEANQLNRLIAELLSLSSLESLHSPVSTEAISLAQLIDSHLSNLQFEANARECSIALSVLADSVVVVDAKLLGRAIENITRNAIRYSPAGGVVDLEVTSQKEPDKTNAILRIMDRGPGVPENMRKTIFRPFVRVDSSRSENTGGFGVGLAIAERAIHLHGGVIEALPRPGGGLIVEVRIPTQVKDQTPRQASNQAPSRA
jgi:two-component system, OmpR family, sensor histidine kinase CpxA